PEKAALVSGPGVPIVGHDSFLFVHLGEGRRARNRVKHIDVDGIELRVEDEPERVLKGLASVRIEAEYESGLEADSVLVAIIDSAGGIADDVLVFSGFLQGVHGNRFEPREQGEAAALAGKPEEIVVHAHVDASLADPVDLERYQCLKQVPGVFLAASYIVVNKGDEFLAALSDLVYHFGD